MHDVTIFDAVTKEIIYRDFTDEEIAESKKMLAHEKKERAARKAKEAARESALAKLADLGLTAEEIAAL